MQYDSVQIITWQEWQKMKEEYPEQKLAPMRWVLMDKNASSRGNRSFAALPLGAKARLVVLGCFEQKSEIRSDSPTASTIGFNLVCSMCA